MFALRVTYLTGRVYSAVFDDGDAKAEPEWPPHPSRLFSALTAAWSDGGGEDELRSALEWLERQGAPRILAGEHTPRKLVQAFVPVNDTETLPDSRLRKARVFRSATLTHRDVYFLWDGVPAPEIRIGLDQILQRTSSEFTWAFVVLGFDGDCGFHRGRESDGMGAEHAGRNSYANSVSGAPARVGRTAPAIRREREQGFPPFGRVDHPV